MEITLDSLAFLGVIAAQFLAVIASSSWETDFHRPDRTSFAWRTYSITSSARPLSCSGTLMPSRVAALRALRTRICSLKPRAAAEVAHLPFRKRMVPIDEQRNDGRPGNELMQHLLRAGLKPRRVDEVT